MMKLYRVVLNVILLTVIAIGLSAHHVRAQCSGLVCNSGNCINGDDWYLISDSNVIIDDFITGFPTAAFTSAASTNLITIKNIPMAVYGPDKMYNSTSEKTFYIDLYFPKSFYNESKKYPVIIYLNGGGFLNTNKEKLTETATRFAAKGFVVAAMNYRTGRLNDSTNLCGGDAIATQALFRAIQDCRVAMRTVKAISSKFTNVNGDYHYDQDGADKFLYLPFIDANKIIIGGESAGSVTVLTTAYYDACDIDEAINYDHALSPTAFKCGSSSAYTCNSVSSNFDFTFDETENASPECKVDFFFPSSNSNYLAAPMNKIKAVIDVKGGVPENYIGHCSDPHCPTSDAGCFGCNSTPSNLTAKYVANTKSDKIPLIAFHGINDQTVPYYHRYQSTYENTTDLINYIDLDNQGCRPYKCTNNNPFPAKAFLFGSRKIYQRLLNKGVCAALFGEPGSDHTFDGDGITRSFIVNQSTLFIKSLAFCGDNCQPVFDEDITWSADAGSINLSSCSGKNIEIQVALTNLNAVGGAIISSFEVQPVLFKVQDPTNNLINFKKMDKDGPYKITDDDFIQFNFEDQLGQNYINAGSTKTITLKKLIASANINPSADNNYTVKLRLRNPNGSDYHSYVDCSVNVPNVLADIQKSGFADCVKLSDMEMIIKKAVVVYPNPSSDQFIITLAETPVSIIILDMEGRIIESIALNGDEMMFSLGNNYRSGMYFLRVTFEDGTSVVEKLVKVGSGEW
ncbi:MAG: T9SS type A sorting domain-containing protein [Chitinophagaceae bacterium]|nr:T9SS type A sorting domain-containing protein [Chitinophagaceae bacterium]